MAISYARFAADENERVVYATIVIMQWPPPERLEAEPGDHPGVPPGFYRRVRMSQMTDKEAAAAQHVARGALYVRETSDEAPKLVEVTGG